MLLMIGSSVEKNGRTPGVDRNLNGGAAFSPAFMRMSLAGQSWKSRPASADGPNT